MKTLDRIIAALVLIVFLILGGTIVHNEDKKLSKRIAALEAEFKNKEYVICEECGVLVSKNYTTQPPGLVVPGLQNMLFLKPEGEIVLGEYHLCSRCVNGSVSVVFYIMK